MKLLLVSPAAFGFNAETAATNRFQQAPASEDWEAASRARTEVSAAAAALRAAGVSICVAQDTPRPVKPDAVFPNNWVSFHEDGTVVVYPLLSPARRLERREEVIEQAKRDLGFVEKRRLDLSGEERHGRFLEGTGSLVLDRAARVAYACRSPRTDEALVREWARQMDYEAVIFDARSPDGTSVYHTNVLLWIGERIAGIGLAWIDAAQRDAVAAHLSQGRDARRGLLLLDTPALRSFAGNMLELPVGRRRLLAMSATAHCSLGPAQLRQLAAADSEPVVVPLPTIESLGGGSMRCMLAEVPAA
ncbi:MAG: arginine deiminase-related protein [Steroidobacteraceae bacterium]